MRHGRFFVAWTYCVLSLCRAGAFDFPQVWITNTASEGVVTWPAGLSSWVLEESTNDPTARAWSIVPADRYEMETGVARTRFPLENETHFFRLRKILPPIPNLTGLWTFDEATPSAANSGGGTSQPLQATNATLDTGRIGARALRLDGSGKAWITNGGYTVLPSNGSPFSVSFWFSTGATTPGLRALAGNVTPEGSGWKLTLSTVGPGTNELTFSCCTLSITGQTRLLPNEWHHVTATHQDSETRLYLDGTLLASGTGELCTHDGPVYFGGGLPGLANFIGRLDELRTFSRCLSAEDVSLTGRWLFEDGEGGIGSDSSVFGNYAQPSGAQVSTPGRTGAGLYLSGGQLTIWNDDYRVLPASGGAFGISFWLRPQSLSGRSGLMSHGGTEAGWRLGLQTNTAGNTELEFCSTNSGGTLALTAPIALTNGVWTKVDVTYNGGIAGIYADGREIGSASGAIRGTTGPLVIGNTNGFEGVIDDLQVHRRERSRHELGPVAETQSETVYVQGTTNILLRGFGRGGRPLTYEIVPERVPTNGVILHVPGSPIVTYNAGPRKGPDAFAYTVSDGEFTSAPAIVNISVVQPHWLSPDGSGDGSGSSPSQAYAAGNKAALEAIWRTNNYYDCFFYAPGTYLTKGWRSPDRQTANPGCKHVGAGRTGAPDGTTLRLVDALQPVIEGAVFVTFNGAALCDDFEVHNMLIDCNATNLPMYTRGEPTQLRIPLATASVVQSIAVQWGNRTTPVTRWQFGGAMEFTVSALIAGSNIFTRSVTSTGRVDVVPVEAEADELVVELTRRDPKDDFYSIVEIEVAGATVSLPKATGPGGMPNTIGTQFPIFSIVDGNSGTAWVSDSNSPVTITIPVALGSAVTGMALQWNCQSIGSLGRAGAAGDYSIRARNSETGEYVDIPFIRQPRSADGREQVTFGTNASPDRVITDELMLVLEDHELGVDFFSLREVTLQNGAATVPIRQPSAQTTYPFDQAHSFGRAFDNDPLSDWASSSGTGISAISVAGNNIKVTGVKIVGFATKPGAECFPINLSPHFRAPNYAIIGNVLVEDCIVSDPAPGNKDGVSAIVVVAGWPNVLTNAVLRRCTVTGLRSQFSYSHGIGAETVEQCFVSDCDIGSYWECMPGVSDYGHVTIRSNRFVNVTHGIYVLMHPGTQSGAMDCINNEIVLSGSGGGWGIASCDVCGPGPSGNIAGLTALGNVIRYADWQLRPTARDGGIHYSDIRHAVIGNNIVALAKGNELRVRLCPAGQIYPPKEPDNCDERPVNPPAPPTSASCLDNLLPGYRRAWFNNRDPAGGLLEVFILRDGVEMFAAEQQWR